jgi:hypothetical protein
MMDRTDMPSNEMQERIDDETFGLVSRAVAARDAEWVAAVDTMISDINDRLWQSVDAGEPASDRDSMQSQRDLLKTLKARMTGDK